VCSDCSKPCGGGSSFRTVTCADELGSVVSSDNCAGIDQLATRQLCNTDPCASPYAFSAGVWGVCSAPCVPSGSTAFPATNRTVQCMDSRSEQSVPLSFCVAANLSAPPEARACNTIQCIDARAGEAGSGAAATPLATLAPAGAAARAACSGILDLAGVCCAQTVSFPVLAVYVQHLWPGVTGLRDGCGGCCWQTHHSAGFLARGHC
jgi:hypothetical protein